MERQNRQGASQLQRDHYDFDLSDGARTGLVLPRKTRATTGAADPVGDRHAEKDRARGTPGDGRWQRVERFAAERSRCADRSRVCGRGHASIVQPSAVFAAAPHPNAARLFQSYLFGPEGQELFVTLGGLRSVHALVKDKPGRAPLSAIKVWKDDPAAAVESQGEEIKRRYAQIFRV